MNGIIKFLFIILLFCFISIACNSDRIIVPVVESTPASQFSGLSAIEWIQLTYEIVRFQDMPAPEASRFYGYAGITLYESVHRGIPGHRSLSGQLNQMPAMPNPLNEEYDWLTVMAAAMHFITRAVLYNPHSYSLSLNDNLYENQIAARKDSIQTEILERSILYGRQIGSAIVEWSNSDNYIFTQTLTYTPPSRTENPANWEPLYPDEVAIEPYLGTNRPFCLPAADACYIPGLPFDIIPGSPFYFEGMEVLNKSRTLTQEERDIARFWEDKTGTGQPPGHWIAITNNMIQRFNLDLAEAVKLHALIGAVIRDSFIAAWETKFRINLLRPKSYIRDYLGEPEWEEYIRTPPWPDYPSGHSVISGAASEILTHVLGDNISFVDSTHGNLPGLWNRTFTSFYHAAQESSWSRLYGGIHFRTAIVNGLEMGRLAANIVLNKIKFQ